MQIYVKKVSNPPRGAGYGLLLRKRMELVQLNNDGGARDVPRLSPTRVR